MAKKAWIPMSDFDWTENTERIRQEEQLKYADEIKESISIGFHLKCLRCGKAYYHTRFAMSEMSYRMYSYCPDCIDRALDEWNKGVNNGADDKGQV